MTPETLDLLLGSVGRWLTYTAVMVVVGSAGALGVLGRAARDVIHRETLQQSVVRLGRRAAFVLIGLAAWRLYAHTYSIFGVDESVTWEYVQLVALETGWGRGWRVQAFVAVLAALIFFSAGMSTAVRRWGLGLAALGVGIGLPMTGHAVAETNAIVGVTLQSIHVVAAGLWIGTLAVTLMVLRMHKADEWHETVFPRAIHHFSPLAVGAVTTLAVVGLITSWLYLDSIPQLWNTGYGRVLTAKVMLFGLTGAVGAYNWKRLTPVLNEPGTGVRLRNAARVEITIAVLALAATSVLVVLPIMTE